MSLVRSTNDTMRKLIISEYLIYFYCPKTSLTDNNFRFGHFAPGKMTQQLKNALGIDDDELPLHIYRMRVLGYPQAWLQEAKIESSGISLFDSKGKRVLDSDEDEGEIDAIKDQYDIKKIFDYPGFNVVPDFPYNEVFSIFKLLALK